MSQIYFSNDSWNKETFEEKLERMKLDKFKKDYPMFSDIDLVIKLMKNKIKIYNENVIRELISILMVKIENKILLHIKNNMIGGDFNKCMVLLHLMENQVNLLVY